MRLLDTWAWMAYIRGSSAGRKVAAVLEEGEVATSVVTIAELADVFHREGHSGLERQVDFIHAQGPLLDVSLPILVAAGATKWAQRRKKAPMGLFDAIIYETARAHGLTVVTGDEGFRGLPHVESLA